MPKGLSLLLFLGYCTLSQGIFLKPVTAQVTPDGTTNTTVDVNGNDFTIQEGDRAGGNLFHSFGEFSVPTDGSAFFNNAADIVNIFSRVTGGNISNIDGLLRANSSANLFLLNPAGIIFGENARLDIGGSFFGTTADSFLFENGEFSATDLDNPPLLTINAPIGLNFRDNPGDIVNQSVVQNSTGDVVGLEVVPGENLTLVGGNINFEAGNTTARGGNIELGGLSAAGTVGINEDGSLNFPKDVAQADLNLSNAADVDVTGTGGGSITINARNLNLEAGDLGSSQIRAGITADSNSAEAQAGDITINATNNVTADESSILNTVNSDAVGDAGGITITTGSLTLTNGGLVNASTSGQGNAGSVKITASDSITIDGEASEGDTSAVFSDVTSEAIGDAGGITITTGSLTLTNGGAVDAGTSGQGDAGSVEITARDSITIDGEASDAFESGVFSSVGAEAVGNAGGITITTGSLTLTNGGLVDAGTFGQGNAGSVKITASDSITIDGETSDGVPSAVFSDVTSEAIGDAGGVTINTGSLTLTNGGEIGVDTFGQGNAGSLTVQANSVSLDNNASISASTQSGEGGIINLRIIEDLTLRNNSLISARAFNKADGGNLNINARFILAFPSKGNGNDLIATAEEGNGGNITINASQQFNLQEVKAIDDEGNFIPNNSNDIDVSSQAEGLDGTISISNPDTNIRQKDTAIPSNPIESEQAVGQACQRTRTADQPSGLTVKGKGGVPPAPTEPFMADALIPDGKPITIDKETDLNSLLVEEIETEQVDPYYIPPDIKPIKTSMGDIYPARGIIKTEDGEIILTVYPTDNVNTRTPDKSANCSLLRDKERGRTTNNK